ncbi:hypothetical protein, partial [Glutamicibacter protophormiae]|uniref:hypothetical protein n=1 Tax=Glutamicibacter protophormiae TaxID=37930 RepID=UPI003A943F4A
MRDEAWKVFAGELKKAMAGGRQPITASELADELRSRVPEVVTADTVHNWRRGRATPTLASLRGVVDAVAALQRHRGVEPVTLGNLLVKMGLALQTEDRELVDKALRLQKLETKIKTAASTAAAVGRESGAGLIVHAAIRSRKWAVGVWPAYEGPDDQTLMHVADRIDIVRISDPYPPEHHSKAPALTVADVWEDPDMKAAL